MNSKEAEKSLAEVSAKVREFDPILTIMRNTSSIAEQTVEELERAIEQVRKERGENISTLHEELTESEIQVVHIAFGLGQEIDKALQARGISYRATEGIFLPLNYNLFMNTLQQSPLSETSQKFISHLIDLTRPLETGPAGIVKKIHLGIYNPITDGRLGGKYNHIAVRPHFTSVLDDPDYAFMFNMGRHSQLSGNRNTWMKMGVEIDRKKIPTEEILKLQQMEITCAFLNATLRTVEAL